MNSSGNGRDAAYLRLKQDREFAIALFNEAMQLFFNGELQVTRLLLRDLVVATEGFEQLALETDKPGRSLQRMLSARGDPTMESLIKIITTLKKWLQLDIQITIKAIEH